MNKLKLNEAVLNLKGLDISKQTEFSTFVKQAKALQSQLDAAWALVDQQMKSRGISQVKGDWGTLSQAERKTWKADDTLPPRFYKQVLDTSKLNFMLTHGDVLPEGLELKVTKYLVRKVA